MSTRPTSPARRRAAAPEPPAPVRAVRPSRPAPRAARPRAVSEPANESAPRTSPVPATTSGARQAWPRAAQAAGSRRLVDAGRRFNERARARRRLTWRNAARGAAVCAVLALLGWVVLGSPLLAVREVQVTGTTRLPPDLVREQVDTARGVPLARIDTTALEARVEELVGVRDATVERAWPGTLVVRTVERVPLAAVPASRRFQVVDADGVVLETVNRAPAGLPLVRVDVASSGSTTLREVVSVVGALPRPLRAGVESVGADSRDSVTLQLAGGRTVVWGSADDSAQKARVLTALLRTPAKVYDVSAPDMPVTR